MSLHSHQYQDPLVVALTRPAMKWGVTLDGIIVAASFIAVLMIATKIHLPYCYIFLCMHLCMAYVCVILVRFVCCTCG